MSKSWGLEFSSSKIRTSYIFNTAVCMPLVTFQSLCRDKIIDYYHELRLNLYREISADLCVYVIYNIISQILLSILIKCVFLSHIYAFWYKWIILFYDEIDEIILSDFVYFCFLLKIVILSYFILCNFPYSLFDSLTMWLFVTYIRFLIYIWIILFYAKPCDF